ncbi:Uncharacterized membrane protein YcaP, DUF421 family [Gracilibacillus ureilyticus]|uniref:Uncharacterized membrane protein YcaP, DUF421 family n=1 Tax=Gracilibacillus ureilyticus TaxID=531814 RepID=A0A1H9TNF6_9BACI|nr:DUF421 domain-containing protein [Gracilibacillus ureilyticus]SER98534.1 Uncharacterized membrane protein YcaP, DUF421 family [Gracilibacillus ureilyticus]
MELDWIWKAVLIIIVGTLLLRIAGRKSISQMTLAQTVLMIAIGSLLIQPVAGKSIWVTFGVSAVLIITLIIVEFTQIKSDKFEKFITGKSVTLIEGGTLNEKNLKKFRISVDLLEMLLRQQSVQNINDVEWATLEPNGQLGYILKDEAQPITKRDLNKLITQLEQLQLSLTNREVQQKQTIFTEVANKGHQKPLGKHLE